MIPADTGAPRSLPLWVVHFHISRQSKVMMARDVRLGVGFRAPTLRTRE